MINEEKMAQGVKLILLGMGVDLTESHFEDTPARVAKLYKEMLTPKANNWTSFNADTTGMIVLRNHRVFALCPHHLMPVELDATVAYIPNQTMLGLSKLARVVETQLTRPITQEELGERVADSMQNAVKPYGVAVILSGAHGCMRYRGIETTGTVVSSVVRGIFRDSAAARDELHSLLRMK